MKKYPPLKTDDLSIKDDNSPVKSKDEAILLAREALLITFLTIGNRPSPQRWFLDLEMGWCLISPNVPPESWDDIDGEDFFTIKLQIDGSYLVYDEKEKEK